MRPSFFLMKGPLLTFIMQCYRQGPKPVIPLGRLSPVQPTKSKFCLVLLGNGCFFLCKFLFLRPNEGVFL